MPTSMAMGECPNPVAAEEIPSLKLYNTEFTPENGWLEYDPSFPFWGMLSILRGELANLF